VGSDYEEDCKGDFEEDQWESADSSLRPWQGDFIGYLAQNSTSNLFDHSG
jgi:hypothetical protein